MLSSFTPPPSVANPPTPVPTLQKQKEKKNHFQLSVPIHSFSSILEHNKTRQDQIGQSKTKKQPANVIKDEKNYSNSIFD